MMVSAIAMLQKRLDSINTHIKVLKRIENITKQQIENDDFKYIQSKQTDEKTFNYQANIISLYGSLEFFIEEVFKEYIEHLRHIIPQYNSLNKKIKDNYFDNVAKLHSKLHYAKFSHITELKIVQNLEKVIVQDNNEILAEPFLGNGGNYKHSIICELMSSVGIDNVDCNIIQLSPLSDLLLELTPDKEQQRKMVAMRLEELVNRRNEVAHRAISDDIINIDSFEDMLKFITVYCESLNKLLVHELLAYKWEQVPSTTYTPSNVYGNAIAELKVKNIHLNIGKKLLIKKQDYPEYIETEIIGLHIKNNTTGDIEEKDSIDINDEEYLISVKVSDKLKINRELKFI